MAKDLDGESNFLKEGAPSPPPSQLPLAKNGTPPSSRKS